MVDTLIYMPTNNCARILLFVKLNDLDDMVTVKSPSDYGGLKTEAYLKVNPMGKLPALIDADGTTVFESAVILDYIADKYSDRLKEDCRASTLASRMKSALICRVHDIYVSSPNCSESHGSSIHFLCSQNVSYKLDMPLEERAARCKDLQKQLNVIEGLMDKDGPFAVGTNITFADIVLFPTYILLEETAPRALGWDDVFANRPTTKKWYMHCSANPVFAEVGRPVHEWFKKLTWPDEIREQIAKCGAGMGFEPPKEGA